MKSKILTVISLVMLTNLSVQAGFALQNRSSSTYLSAHDGTRTCTAAATFIGEGQVFTRHEVFPLHSDRYYIKSTQTGKYLRRSGNENKVTATTSEASISDERMHWDMDDVENSWTYTHITNVSNGKKLRGNGLWSVKTDTNSDYAKRAMWRIVWGQ